MALLFRARESPERADASRRIAAYARQALSLGEDDAVTVSEIACGDPECGGAETVILIMRVGRKTEAVKVKKAMALATEGEVAEALRGL
ncbi:hypothetical protein ACFQI3_04170 [Hansschlegelia quercus]|uniref:Nitrate reductase n=1 Tax=Hansschlegelia quercus TaxID=2528245 RepID=A0A4Q9GL10_9HYPH|nr:hypothetical protein [Hansschlegelia quercus]TBN55079.1 hypothetical protein EYR15_02760 [Hansschlegelia quercus]